MDAFANVWFQTVVKRAERQTWGGKRTSITVHEHPAVKGYREQKRYSYNDKYVASTVHDLTSQKRLMTASGR